MFRSTPSSQEPETPLEATARQYARVGYSVTSRTVNAMTLARSTQAVRLTTDADGKISIDGPPLDAFAFDGRMRAWLLLLALLIAAFAVAWALGFFRT